MSLNMQAKLGLIKNMRTGVCQLADYPGEVIELARDHRSGLVVMCISSFLDHECHDILKPLMIDPGTFTTLSDKTDSLEVRDNSPENNWCTMAKKKGDTVLKDDVSKDKPKDNSKMS